MEISLVASRAGPPACRAGDSWLHSRFDPAREAERFAAASLGGGRPPAVVMLGPCLDYLGEATRRILPRATIVSIQHSTFFRDKEVFDADFRWYPDSQQSLDAFLDSALGEDSVSGIAILSWPPAEAAFPDQSRAARAALRSSLDRLASSAATVKVFGRRWIANACRNFLLAREAIVPTASAAPVVVAAAGPTLRSSLAEIAPMRGSYALVAVSSALAACRSAGLEPDVVVATDGGNWSRPHLYPLSSRRSPLAAPLTALPSACLARCAPCIFIDQGGFAESELLPSIGAPAGAVLGLPPHGTVSGTAIHLASRLGAGPIVAVGLDLACKGDADHARPHGFDQIHARSSSRLAPEEVSRWSRAAESSPDPLPESPWRSSRSLSAYASGLDVSMRALRGRLFRLDPSPVPLSSFESLDATGLEGILGRPSRPRDDRPGPFAGEPFPLPPAAVREASLRRALSEWREMAAEAAGILASGGLAFDERVGELLRSIDIVDYAAARRAVANEGDPTPTARELGRRADDFLSGLLEKLAS